MYLAVCAVTRFTALRKKGRQASTSGRPDREIGLCWVYIGDVCWILYFTEPHILATHTAHLPTDSTRPTHTPTSACTPTRHTCRMYGTDSSRSCDRGKINVFGNVCSNPIHSFAKKGEAGKCLRRTDREIGLCWVYVSDVYWILYFTEPHILATHSAHLPTDSTHISRPTHTPTLAHTPIGYTCRMYGTDLPRSCDRGKINVFGNVCSNPIHSFAKKGEAGKYLRRTRQRNRVVLGLHR
jgi:hypothetical protein